MTQTQAFREAAYPQETGEAFVMLFRIEHDTLPTPILLTDAGGTWSDAAGANALTVGSDLYISAPMEIVAPGQSDDEPTGKIRVPNVDQRIGQALDALPGPATCTVTAVLESSPTTIVGGPHALLYLQNVKGDALTFAGDLKRPGLTVEPWPKEWVRPNKYLAAFK